MTRVLASYKDQNETQERLLPLVDANQEASLKQALNQAYNLKGKNSDNHEVEGYGEVHIFHASAGDEGKGKGSATLFYFFDGGRFKLIALGQHVGTDRYQINDQQGQGQAEAPFERGRVVSATGRG